MASGKLGSADLASSTATLMYTVPAGKTATVSIRVANRNSTSVTVRTAVGSGASPANTDYLTYDASVPGNGILEDTGIVVSAGEKIWVYSSAASVSARVHGFEE